MNQEAFKRRVLIDTLNLCKIPELGPCWLWIGCTQYNGYGQITIDYKTLLVHRFAYELFKGPIPDDLEIDHLCRIKRCCNPVHLEAVTHSVNVSRATSFNGSKTYCPQGHEYSELNTYITKKGRRKCRRCHNEREKLR